MSAPDVSVVVATRDRPELLARLRAALVAQDYSGEWEVVVVEDGPEPAGPAAARNKGWRGSTAQVIAFTDDDCEPEPGWLSALMSAIGAGADVVQGRTLPAWEGVHGAFSHTLRIESESGRFETCNMAYRRSVLEEVGGFDEGFRYPYGEDIDLGLRALGSGARFVFAPDAVVRHAVHPSSFRDRLRSTLRQEGLVMVVARHPSFRRSLRGRVWATPTHPHSLLCLVGGLLFVAGFRRLGLALQVPFVAYRARVEQLPARKWQWPVVLPLAVVLDLAEVAVLLRASLKHRTPVL